MSTRLPVITSFRVDNSNLPAIFSYQIDWIKLLSMIMIFSQSVFSSSFFHAVQFRPRRLELVRQLCLISLSPIVNGRIITLTYLAVQLKPRTNQVAIQFTANLVNCIHRWKQEHQTIPWHIYVPLVYFSVTWWIAKCRVSFQCDWYTPRKVANL